MNCIPNLLILPCSKEQEDENGSMGESREAAIERVGACREGL